MEERTHTSSWLQGLGIEKVLRHEKVNGKGDGSYERRSVKEGGGERLFEDR